MGRNRQVPPDEKIVAKYVHGEIRIRKITVEAYHGVNLSLRDLSKDREKERCSYLGPYSRGLSNTTAG